MFRLTIVTATYNRDNLLKAIETLNDQTFTNWQHIIVNDNSSDNRDIIPSLCDGIKRHWVDLHLRTHFYGGIARNIGAMIAFSYIHHSQRDIDNEWVIFLDDDNLWQPNHLELLINAAIENPEATLIASDMELVGQNDKEFRQIRKCRLKHCYCDLGQFMYKTKLFREYGYFFPHPHRKHKYDWELIKKITDGEAGRIAYTNQPTFIMNYKKK